MNEKELDEAIENLEKIEKKQFSDAKEALSPIGADGVVIGVHDGQSDQRTYFIAFEKDGVYYADEAHTVPLKTVPASGTGVLDSLTRRGSLLGHIEESDSPGTGAYCYLISVENLRRSKG